MENKYLKDIEKKAWQANYKDGLFDLYFGFMLLGNAMAAIIDLNWGLTYAGTLSFIIMFVIGCVIVFLGKRFVSRPRIGRMAPGPFRLKRMLLLIVIIGLAVLSTLALWIFPTFMGDITDSIPIVPIYFFLFIGAIFGSIAWLLDYKRGYVITIIFAASWGLNELFIFFTGSRAVGGIIFEVGGFIIIAMGLYVFARFLRRFPLPEAENDGGPAAEVA